MKELKHTLPLPSGFELIEEFQETTRVGCLKIELSGLIAKRGSLTVSGSAAAIGTVPSKRAYYELYERCVTMAAKARGGQFALLGKDGERLGEVPALELFMPDERSLRYASSNGVAAGPDFGFASERALLECLERDAILRSWYGLLALERIRLADSETIEALAEMYELSCHQILSAGCVTAVAVAFPRNKKAPLLLGFGAHWLKEKARDKALEELVQRLGFLWGEELPAQVPVVEPSPNFHQEYYLYAGHHQAIRDWLAGAHLGLATVLPQALRDGPDLSRVCYADLSDPSEAGRAVVLRACVPESLPLTFGLGSPSLKNLQPSLTVHPIC